MDNRRYLEGNGVAFVRERAMATAVQGVIERVYALDTVCEVDPFVVEAESGERETVLVRETDDGLEISVLLPPLGEREFALDDARKLDPLCQLIEGVSHFVYITGRASHDRSVTQLELELQAEVDKYVVLSLAAGRRFDRRISETLRERLFEHIEYADGEDTENGERYRMANRVANRYTRHLESRYLGTRKLAEMRADLRAFYRMGLSDKLLASSR